MTSLSDSQCRTGRESGRRAGVAAAARLRQLPRRAFLGLESCRVRFYLRHSEYYAGYAETSSTGSEPVMSVLLLDTAQPESL
jgi:hypothetical protein